MFPVMMDLTLVPVALIGNGKAALRRLEQLEEAGAKKLTIYAPEPVEGLKEAAGRRLSRRLPEPAELRQFRLVMIVDLDEMEAEYLASTARRAGVLVNVEDVKPLCDFHFPSMIRRGDLLLTASTGGQSPALARYIRQWMEEVFGYEWKERTEFIAKKREEWKKLGLTMEDIFYHTSVLIDKEGWLPEQHPDDEEEAA